MALSLFYSLPNSCHMGIISTKSLHVNSVLLSVSWERQSSKSATKSGLKEKAVRWGFGIASTLHEIKKMMS
jgi:hypothetical protein